MTWGGFYITLWAESTNVIFGVSLNKQSRSKWFETPWSSCEVAVMNNLCYFENKHKQGSNNYVGPYHVTDQWDNPVIAGMSRINRTDPLNTAPARRICVIRPID